MGGFLAGTSLSVPRRVGNSPIKLKTARLIAPRLYYSSGPPCPCLPRHFANARVAIGFEERDFAPREVASTAKIAGSVNASTVSYEITCGLRYCPGSWTTGYFVVCLVAVFVQLR